MSNDAWADDPSFRVISSDDPDSIKLKRFLALWVWPGYAGLLVLALSVVVFQAWWALASCWWMFGLWLLAQFVLRPKKFGAELAKAWGALDDMIDRIREAKIEKDEARAASTGSIRGLMSAVGVSESAAAPPPEPAPERPRKPIDWRWLWLIPAAVIAVVVLALWNSVAGLFDGPSGREVAAQAREDEARARERTAQAEVVQQGQAVARVETHYVTVERIVRETQEARDALQAADDLDARIAIHGEFTQRMRDTAAGDRAAAVRDYDSSLAP